MSNQISVEVDFADDNEDRWTRIFSLLDFEDGLGSEQYYENQYENEYGKTRKEKAR